MKQGRSVSGGVLRALVIVVVCVAGITASLAQEVTGSISGTVTDPSGAAIKGATVTLINTDRKGGGYSAGGRLHQLHAEEPGEPDPAVQGLWWDDGGPDHLQLELQLPANCGEEALQGQEPD